MIINNDTILYCRKLVNFRVINFSGSNFNIKVTAGNNNYFCIFSIGRETKKGGYFEKENPSDFPFIKINFLVVSIHQRERGIFFN